MATLDQRPPNRTIGPYRIIRHLGSGGMASVYLAVALGASGFSKEVALKTLLPQLRGNPQFQRALIEEARLGGLLQHRNLVQIHDLALWEGSYFLRMDYVAGVDLRRLLAARRPTAGVALMILEEVILALGYIHRALDHRGRPLGLVHRDVSPSNLLLSRAGEVKLSDLGIAKSTMLADITRAGVHKGKYAYMSPEQIGGGPLTHRSDQFSLGVVAMELLCGRRPFEGRTPLATMERVRAAEPPELSDLDEDLAALVRRCLSGDPDRRYESDEALRVAVAGCRRTREASVLDLARLIADFDPFNTESTSRPPRNHGG